MLAFHNICAAADKVQSVIATYLNEHRRPGKPVALGKLREKLSIRTIVDGQLVASFNVDPEKLIGVATIRCLGVPRAQLVLPLPFSEAFASDRWDDTIESLIVDDLRQPPAFEYRGPTHAWGTAEEADKPAIFEAMVDAVLEAEEADYQRIVARYVPAYTQPRD
jgi:hypothetical protein